MKLAILMTLFLLVSCSDPSPKLTYQSKIDIKYLSITDNDYNFYECQSEGTIDTYRVESNIFNRYIVYRAGFDCKDTIRFFDARLKE